jgi:acyl-CoA dehydrogenase
MDFSLSPEQDMVVRAVRGFVENELYPHEAAVERQNRVPPELGAEIQRKVRDLGFYAANMPEAIGGGGLDRLTFALVERELGRASMALTVFFGRPSNILLACTGEQRERYLMPAVRGEKIDALAITEPGAGSDARGMTTTARADGSDFLISGTKHFISHADVADFIILFAVTGTEEAARGGRKRLTCFLVDRDTLPQQHAAFR